MSDARESAHSLADYLNERFALSTEIVPETDLVAAGLLESLTIMDLLAHIEQTYAVTFEPLDIRADNFQSTARLGALIDSKRSQLASA